MTWRAGGLVLILAVSACGPESKASRSSAAASGAGGVATAAGAPGAGGTGQVGGDAGSVGVGGGPEGPWPCTASIEIELPAVPVRGTVTGDALRGTLCAGGIGAFAQDFTNPDTGELLTALVFAGPGPTDPRFQFELPAGTGEANLEGRIGIGSGNPQPGTFTNQDSCGSFLLAADIPPAGSDTFALYTASATSNCETTSPVTYGAWSLTLTSVTPFPQDGSDAMYITHGQLTATLEAGSSPPRDTIQLDLAF